MNFTDIANELLERTDTNSFDIKNKEHMEILKEVLGNYIKNEELLYHVLHAFKYPDET